MNMPERHESRSLRSILVRALKLVWLPVAVFVAFELSLPEDTSILRSAGETDDQPQSISADNPIATPVPPLREPFSPAESPHTYFGLEEDPLADSDRPTSGDASVTALGEWSGRFAGILAGDEDVDCWSAYDFALILNESAAGVSGSGSYWVDPASCSQHTTRFVAFVEANGTRSGNSVNIDISGTGNGQPVLRFDGLLMRSRLSGWFYLPDGRPVSGPVVLARK